MHNLTLLDSITEFMPDAIRLMLERLDYCGFYETFEGGEDISALESCVISLLQHRDFIQRWDFSELSHEELTALKEWHSSTVTLHRVKQVN